MGTLKKFLPGDALATCRSNFSVLAVGRGKGEGEEEGGVHVHPMHPRSTQPCIPPGSLNRVPASAGIKAGKSPLPGGR